jgi:hypothetical protein
MEPILHELLGRLYAIGEAHEELYDTEVSELITDAVYFGFLKPTPGYQMPDDLGLSTPAANAQLRTVLRDFIDRANAFADQAGWDFHQRLDAFQNLDVTFGSQDVDYNDFFRYTPPEKYNAAGEPLPKRP